MVRADHPYGLIPSLLLRVSLSPVWCIGALGMASGPPWQRWVVEWRGSDMGIPISADSSRQRWVGGNDRGEWRVRRFGPIAIAAAIAARVALGLVSICTPTGPRADDVPLDGRWAVLCPAVPRGPRACHRAV